MHAKSPLFEERIIHEVRILFPNDVVWQEHKDDDYLPNYANCRRNGSEAMCNVSIFRFIQLHPYANCQLEGGGCNQHLGWRIERDHILRIPYVDWVNAHVVKVRKSGTGTTHAITQPTSCVR